MDRRAKAAGNSEDFGIKMMPFERAEAQNLWALGVTVNAVEPGIAQDQEAGKAGVPARHHAAGGFTDFEA